MKSRAIIFILTIFFLRESAAREDFRTGFIKSLILNEQKPAIVTLCDVCWSKYDKIYFTNEMSKIGTTVSTSLSNKMKYQDHNLLYILDLECRRAKQIIDMATAKGLFQRPYRWLVFDNSNNKSSDDNKIQYLMDSPLLPDSELVLAERKENAYFMMELHRPSMNHRMMFTPRGHYNGTFFDVRQHKTLFRRRMDLMGHPLTMSNVIQDSNNSIYHLPREDGLDFKNDPIAKISWMNAKVAFLMLNATPRYIFSYRWGYKVNGEWSGMINDLNMRKADIGTNCVVSNKERLTVVGYTDTLAPFKVRFIFRQPPLSYVANIYSLPFSSGLWLGTTVCALISALAICIAARWELKFGGVKSSSQLDGGVSDAVFWTMSAVSQQGSDMEPRRTPGRIIGWVVFTALMALYAAYSANIVVLLQAPSNYIRTLSQLANSKLVLAANDVDYNHFIFKQYKDPVRVSIYKRIEPPKGRAQFYHLNEGVERIRKGLFAYHSLDSQVYHQIEETFQESEKCDLTDIDFMNALAPYAPMKKDSPYLELMRVAFKRMRETGVNSAIVRRYHVGKPLCSKSGAAFSSVGVSDLKPVLVLMGIGAAASLIVLALEIAVFRTMKNKKKEHSLHFNEIMIKPHYNIVAKKSDKTWKRF